MTYEETIVSLVRLQYDALNTSKKVDIHILPMFTRVDIRDKRNGSVRTVTIERTSNFVDLLGLIVRELYLERPQMIIKPIERKEL